MATTPVFNSLVIFKSIQFIWAILLIIFGSTLKTRYDFLKTSSTGIFFPFSNATIKAEVNPLDMAI